MWNATSHSSCSSGNHTEKALKPSSWGRGHRIANRRGQAPSVVDELRASVLDRQIWRSHQEKLAGPSCNMVVVLTGALGQLTFTRYVVQTQVMRITERARQHKARADGHLDQNIPAI